MGKLGVGVHKDKRLIRVHIAGSTEICHADITPTQAVDIAEALVKAAREVSHVGYLDSPGHGEPPPPSPNASN